MDTVFEQERGDGGAIHAPRDDNNITSALQNTKKSAQGHLEQKAGNADIQCSAPP
jgi:hypothetical protein